MTGLHTKLDVVLRRKVGEKKFSELLLGDKKGLQEYKECLKDAISEELKAKIAD